MKKRLFQSILVLSLATFITIVWPFMGNASYAAADDVAVYAATDVKIDVNNFPDDVFRQYVNNYIDNGDGVLSDDEIRNCTYINCSFMNIYDLTGIEYFYNLKVLECEYNNLTTLDVSSNTFLDTLYCYNNHLSTLDISKNTVLQDFDCSENRLTTLDVSKNVLLTDLACSGNDLSSLDVSRNTALTDLKCYGNMLRTLDVSKNTSLTNLECYKNYLIRLDVSKNVHLTSLECFVNNLSSLDVSKNTALTYLDCGDNDLSSLDVSQNTTLKNLRCENNALNELDLSKNTALVILWCDNNNLNNLYVGKNTDLLALYCYNNHLTSLDVSQNNYLRYFDCSNNQLNSLDVSGCVSIKEFDCSVNNLSSLNVREFIDLSTLSCNDNNLTSLDISKNMSLTYLYCYNNNLTSLDISHNAELRNVICFGNLIDSIDTSKNKNLSRLLLLNTPVINVPTVTSSGITVSWSQSVGAAGYRIYRRTPGGNWQRIAEVTGGNTLSFVDKDISPGTTYEYTVRGYSNLVSYNDNQIILSDYDHLGKSITVLLSTPSISRVSRVNGGVQLNWSEVTGAEKYRVFYRNNVNSSWTKLADTTATSYIWNEAKNGSTYIFTVRCISSDGKTYTSNYDSTGKTITYTASTLATPSISSVSGVNGGIQITWNSVPDAEKYRVFYRTSVNSIWTKITDTTATSYTWDGAKTGTNYIFTVRCVSSDGKNYTSNYNAAGKSITYVATPKITSVDKTDNGVQITWDKVDGAERYRVFYRTSVNSSWTKIADTTATGYTWTGVESGTTYIFTVRCISDDGKTYMSSYDAAGKTITTEK